ncbi:MAG: hypothetical protein ACREQ9_00575 [Candidatus Binatia bacterium]
MPQHLPTPVDPAIFASLEPDTVLPEQFFAEQQPNWTGELSLMWTVFTDGIETFRKEVLNGNEGSEVYLETIEWIQLRSSDSVFGFESLCETFGLNPEFVRRSLFAWRARQRVRTAKAA